MYAHGTPLGRIQIGEGISEEDDFYHSETHRCLGDIFSDADAPRTAFFNFPMFSVSIYDRSKFFDLPQNLNHPTVIEILDRLRAPAQYGDLLQQKTREDHSVRKGFDIDLNDPVKSDYIYLNSDIPEKLGEKFSKHLKIPNVIVKPHKINIYHAGDFFAPHVDSSEKNLLGTIVMHIGGDYGCMVIDGTIWNPEHGNGAMFYTDVPHQVNVVPSFRMTMTFKVYSHYISGNLPHLARLNVAQQHSQIVQNMAHRVHLSQSFSVLLQNMYTHDNILTGNKNAYLIDNLKGKDKILYDVVQLLGYKIAFIPVVVLHRTDVDRDPPANRYQSCSYSSDDEESKWVKHEDGYTRTDLHGYLLHEECHGTADEISDSLMVHTVSEEMMTFLHNITVEQASELYSDLYDDICIPDNTIYYMGLGQKFGSIEHKQLYIGNQYTGSMRENLYLNFMMVCIK